SGAVRNVTIVNADVTARNNVNPDAGILAGTIDGGTSSFVVSHVKVGGRVTCTLNCWIGGLAGVLDRGVTLTHSSSSADVSAPTSTGYSGGLVGFNTGSVVIT